MDEKCKCESGAPKWMTTFADLMGLLLVLFVLLLTFATLDVIKFKAVAGSMKKALGTARESKLTGVIEIDGSIVFDKSSATTPEITEPSPPAPPSDAAPSPESDVPFRIDPQDKPEDPLLAEIESAIAQELGGQGVDVERTGDEVIVSFPDKLAFGSGSANLSLGITPALKRIADIVAKHQGEVIVSGHTDDIPISSGRFSSNWELSASRATSVVHQLLENKELNADRVTVQGFGASRPLVANSNPENRAKNRRVEISILSPKGEKIDFQLQ